MASGTNVLGIRDADPVSDGKNMPTLTVPRADILAGDASDEDLQRASIRNKNRLGVGAGQKRKCPFYDIPVEELSPFVRKIYQPRGTRQTRRGEEGPRG